jgi:hypothetical protein
MEPLRPKVDSKVLDFLRSHTFSPSDFLLTSGGVVRLHPQLARIVAGLSVANSETLTMIDVVSRHMSTGRAAVATVDPAASTV